MFPNFFPELLSSPSAKPLPSLNIVKRSDAKTFSEFNCPIKDAAISNLDVCPPKLTVDSPPLLNTYVSGTSTTTGLSITGSLSEHENNIDEATINDKITFLIFIKINYK